MRFWLWWGSGPVTTTIADPRVVTATAWSCAVSPAEGWAQTVVADIAWPAVVATATATEGA